MSISTFLEQIKADQPVSFDDTIATINKHYHYTPSSFTNGIGDTMVTNTAGTNEGSCKIFAFALLNHLNQAQTLQLFGNFYQDVLNDPTGNSHQNIRNFMQYAWEGIKFQNANILRLK